MKHAEASRIDISLLWNENRIEIMVADNGKGFDKERKGTGIGMNIIRERVRNLKGQLRIDTAPGKGTKIQVELSTVICDLIGELSFFNDIPYFVVLA